MKKKLCFVTFVIMMASLCLCGCGGRVAEMDSTGEFYLAAEPSAEDKKEIDSVVEDFIECYEESNAKEASSLFTKDFTGTEEDLKVFFTQIHEVCKNPFVPFDSYYIAGVTPSETAIKVKHREDDTNYMEVVPGSDELYYGIYVSEGEKISYVLSLTLAKESGSWKIAWVNPGEFKYGGKDAPALYEKTTELHEKGDTMSAYLYSCMLSSSFRPGGFYRYEKDTEMEDICYKLYAEVTDKFPTPLALENTTSSEVYSIRITRDEEQGIIPLFLVKTGVSVADSDALALEAEKVIDALELLSPGFRSSFSHVTFSMTNQQIDENNPTPTDAKSFVLKLEA